ncbi:MAG: type I glyceraldehyde-3-phosphate dehydrogenase [Candidatus Pacearchaeota archaeon]
MRIAINGFGRIGRQFFLAALEANILKDIVAINDLADSENLAYLLKYDSIHGKRKDRINFTKDSLIINGRKILFLNEKDTSKYPWKKLKIDLVVESTGVFTDREGCEMHLNAGAKKVLLTAPGKNSDCFIVPGVNSENLKKEHNIISMASCTSNCIAPIVKVINDNFSIERGYMVTTHAITADQKIVDSPHKDFRRGRTASINIVPTSTGAAKMVGEIIPELKGKLDGYALRVPVADGSICNFTCIVNKKVTAEEVNEAFERISAKGMRGILEYCSDPIVSTDIIHNPSSCVFDSLMTKVIGNMVNVVGWYDNEWGYSCRLVDAVKIIKNTNRF